MLNRTVPETTSSITTFDESDFDSLWDTFEGRKQVLNMFERGMYLAGLTREELCHQLADYGYDINYKALAVRIDRLKRNEGGYELFSGQFKASIFNVLAQQEKKGGLVPVRINNEEGIPTFFKSHPDQNGFIEIPIENSEIFLEAEKLLPHSGERENTNLIKNYLVTQGYTSNSARALLSRLKHNILEIGSRPIKHVQDFLKSCGITFVGNYETGAQALKLDLTNPMLAHISERDVRTIETLYVTDTVNEEESTLLPA